MSAIILNTPNPTTTNPTTTNPTTTNPTTNPTTTTITTANPVEINTMIMNGGLATEEELELDSQARLLLSQMSIPLSTDDIHIHFYPPTNSKNLVTMKNKFVHMLILLGNLQKNRTLPLKQRNKSIKKLYNKILNSFLGMVLESSPLHNLLFVNEQLKCVSRRVPRVRERIDFIDAFGGIIGKSPYVLHTKGPQVIGGGRTEFDTPQACLSAMRACIEGCVDWKTHIKQIEGFELSSYCIRSSFHGRQYNSTRVELYGRVRLIHNDPTLYALKIPFVGSEYWIESDDSRLRHILCAGNPPKVDLKSQQRGLMSEDDTEFQTIYPHYAEFLRLVKAQIKQIVRNSHSNDLCPITIIPCCRIEPVCSGETYTKKVQKGGSKLVTCGVCQMDLCAGGCGRVHHGNTPCSVSLDEASATFIRGTSKPCPQCGVNIYKTDGCNHMSCRCKCEFCWSCGIEMPRDIHGRYRTDLHFGVLGEGVDGGCHQFD